MFVVLLHYKRPLSEVDQYVVAHRKYLARCYESGQFLLSGRMEPRTGGVILARGNTKSEIEDLLREDPFCVAEVAEYELIEFIPSMSSSLLSVLCEA